MAENSDLAVEPGAAEKAMGDAIDWSQYDGKRLMASNSGAVWLVMWGQLHLIPDPATYLGIFANWSGINENDYLVLNIPQGQPIAPGAFIAVAQGNPAQYLISMGSKLWIPNPDVRAQFNFAEPIEVPALALDYIPTGQAVS